MIQLCSTCEEDCEPVLDCYFCGRVRCINCATAIEDIGQVCRECIGEGRGAKKD
jgi:hypothetical protein